MNENLKEDIKSLLLSNKSIEKKQVALFLNPDDINKVDEYVKTLSHLSNKKINKNDLFEMAIKNLIETLPDIIEEYTEEKEAEEAEFDTIVCPSRIAGRNVFLNEKKWYYVKISEKRKPFIKYICVYFGDPVSAITHYAKVKNIEEFESGKNVIYLDGDPIELENKIPLGSINAMAVRNTKFTTLKKVLSAKEYSDLN